MESVNSERKDKGLKEMAKKKKIEEGMEPDTVAVSGGEEGLVAVAKPNSFTLEEIKNGVRVIGGTSVHPSRLVIYGKYQVRGEHVKPAADFIDSVRSAGIMSSIGVTPLSGESEGLFAVLYGFKRAMAAQTVAEEGVELEAPVRIYDISPVEGAAPPALIAQVVSTMENAHRTAMTLGDKARNARKMKEAGLTGAAVAVAMAVNPSYVSRLVSIANAMDRVKGLEKAVEKGILPQNALAELIVLKDDLADKLIAKVVAKGEVVDAAKAKAMADKVKEKEGQGAKRSTRGRKAGKKEAKPTLGTLVDALESVEWKGPGKGKEKMGEVVSCLRAYYLGDETLTGAVAELGAVFSLAPIAEEQEEGSLAA